MSLMYSYPAFLARFLFIDDPMDIRNIAIIAHVDSTTLKGCALKPTGFNGFRYGETKVSPTPFLVPMSKNHYYGY